MGVNLPPSRYLHVELSQVVVQNPAGQAAEAEVGAEAGGTGIQGARVDPRVFQTGHPHLRQHTDGYMVINNDAMSPI